MAAFQNGAKGFEYRCPVMMLTREVKTALSRLITIPNPAPTYQVAMPMARR